MHLMLRSLFILVFPFLFFVAGFAQSKQFADDIPVPGEVIVRFQSEEAVADVLEDLGAAFGSPLTLKLMLSPRYHIALLGFDPARIRSAALMDGLRQRREVTAAQWNYQVEFRGIPNDPFYAQQWTLERIGLPAVWDVTPGGISATGDTIVVAVLDRGFDTAHEDLRDNIWYNRFEIAGDGIDNDNNGFVDDIAGWNFFSASPLHRTDAHGTSVTGIVGARGNNGIGVTGVNMHVRLMLLTINNTTDIIAAYNYVIEQRRRYNESRGAAGAFVVATNASFGQPRVFCSQQPVWGGMYDLLGEVGVLTGAATVNSNYDVDVEGDMPSTCTSPYIISVLNTTREDRKHQGSGFGKVSIDIGSPGQDSYTTTLNNQYATFGFNSAAAPHLTGVIALLYSLPCEGLAADAVERPAQTALRIREAILKGVDMLPDLADKTATGGRLNAFRSMEEIRIQCTDEPGLLNLVSLTPNPVDDFIRISYQAPDFDPIYRMRIFDALGRTVYTQAVKPPRFGEKVEEVNVSRWPAGVYFVLFERGSKFQTRRFVVY